MDSPKIGGKQSAPDCEFLAIGLRTACEIRPLSVISQFIWIEGFGETGEILSMSFIRHLRQQVLRA